MLHQYRSYSYAKGRHKESSVSSGSENKEWNSSHEHDVILYVVFELCGCRKIFYCKIKRGTKHKLNAQKQFEIAELNLILHYLNKIPLTIKQNSEDFVCHEICFTTYWKLSKLLFSHDTTLDTF